MPPRNRKRRRGGGRRPNVFVQTEQPSERRQTTEEGQTEATAAPEPSPILAATSATLASRKPAGARRTQRTRSEVYARTFPLEIRKMGFLAAGIVVALTVFTIVL
jgi:hypothetical protein